MKAKMLIIVLAILALVSTLAIIIINNKEEEGTIYINISDNTVPGNIYTYNMDKEGNYKMHVYHASSAIDGKATEEDFEGKYTKKELSKVFRIIKIINTRKHLYETNGYLFYYDFNGDNNISYDYFKALRKLMLISKEDKIKESLLDEIISNLN